MYTTWSLYRPLHWRSTAYLLSTLGACQSLATTGQYTSYCLLTTTHTSIECFYRELCDKKVLLPFSCDRFAYAFNISGLSTSTEVIVWKRAEADILLRERKILSWQKSRSIQVLTQLEILFLEVKTKISGS